MNDAEKLLQRLLNDPEVKAIIGAEIFGHMTMGLSYINQRIHVKVMYHLLVASNFLKIDRLGLFILIESQGKEKWELKGIIGKVPEDVVGKYYDLEIQFKTDDKFLARPTKDIGWDGFLPIRNKEGKAIAILAFDDTSTDREFSELEMELIEKIGGFFGELLIQGQYIEELKHHNLELGIKTKAGLDDHFDSVEIPKRGLCLAVIDIDNMHESCKGKHWDLGYKILKTLVTLLKKELRLVGPYDELACFHGESDELILVIETDPAWLKRQLENIIKIFQETIITVKKEGEKTSKHNAVKKMSFSVGVIPLVMLNPRDGIDTAKEALNVAKQSGKAKVTIDE